jgi:hypothetical protein
MPETAERNSSLPNTVPEMGRAEQRQIGEGGKRWMQSESALIHSVMLDDLS